MTLKTLTKICTQKGQRLTTMTNPQISHPHPPLHTNRAGNYRISALLGLRDIATATCSLPCHSLQSLPTARVVCFCFKKRIPKTPHYTPFFASVPATSLDLCHPLPMPSLLHLFLRMHSRASPPPCTRRKEASASASAAATALPVACRSVAGSLSLYLLGKTKPAA